MIQPTTIRNSATRNLATPNLASSRTARTLLMLASFSVLGLPTLAVSALSGSQVQPARTTQAQNTQAQKNGTPAPGNQVGGNRPGQLDQRDPADGMANLEVSYYSGDPLAGGKLIGTVRLTAPQGAPTGPVAGNRTMANRAAGNQASVPRPNPLSAQAPAGAKFAVIRDGHGGARIIDLSRADQRMDGPAGRGGPRSQDGTPPQR